MFYIHDSDGIKFTGPLEQLEQWDRVIRKPNVPAKKAKEETSSFSPAINEMAVTAYKKSIAADKSMVEPLVHAHQIMSSPVRTIGLDTLLVDAIDELGQASVRQLVVTNEQRKVIGMLSDRDVLKLYTPGEGFDQQLLNQPVREIINREIISSHSISDIRRMARVLATFHIDALPVVEDETLIGIVTRGDILRGFAENPKLNLYA